MDISGMVGMIVCWPGKVAPVLYQVQGGTWEAGGELTRVSGMWLFNQLCMVCTLEPDKKGVKYHKVTSKIYFLKFILYICIYGSGKACIHT